MSTGRVFRPPLWGNFVGYADWDLLTFGWLYCGGLRLASYYHAVQAIEKYLKALTLSLVDPDGVRETAKNNAWLRTHDLVKLARRCEQVLPFYGQTATIDALTRFSEFDQATRYPWVERKHGNGFSSADVPLICELVSRIRMDLPIQLDDYVLGMVVRGHHQGIPTATIEKDLVPAVTALRRILPNLDQIVRW